MKRRLIIVGFMLAMLSIGLAVLSGGASALSGKDFNPGRIIDDSIFYNSNSMTVDQIQNFLNSKVPLCDTNGSQPASEWGYSNISRAEFAKRKREGTHNLKQDSGFHAPPYTCLKDYKADTPQVGAASGYCSTIPAASNQTAAQMIFNVSKACGINPQVFLVLLEKEQSLVTDIWPLDRQLKSATGFACPDTADCDPAYRGAFQQIYNAGKQFKIYQAQPNHPDFNYRAGRTQRIHFQTNLGSFVNPTGNASDSSRNGQGGACGYTNIYIENQATAGLYVYTPYQPNQAALNNLRGTGDDCSAYGNRNFWRLFNDWFGSSVVKTIPACDSKLSNITCVWNVTKSDGSQFLTANRSELENTVNNLGWRYEGVAFYAASKSSSGLVPVYRLLEGNRHLYTADQGDRSHLTQNGWKEEGVAFYAAPPQPNNNTSYHIYSLYRVSDNMRYITASEDKDKNLKNLGYTSGTGNFRSLSKFIPFQNQSDNLLNIHRLSSSTNNLYTLSLSEADSAISIGYNYNGIATRTSNNSSGTAVYRMQSNGVHIYTSSANERDHIVKTYGYKYEGTAFYIDAEKDIFRLRNSKTGQYLLLDSVEKLMSTSNLNNWNFETALNDKPSEATRPVYRLLNTSNGRHLYTVNLNEAAGIVNKGWSYENIAFNVSKTSDLPVYRLRLNDKYLYTTSESEKNSASKKYSYVVEGIAFYASKTQTSKPVYRLQGGSSNEYFYTTSKQESDQAQSKYGYALEGVGFYIP